MAQHFIKCDKEVYLAVLQGVKKFEFRKNDRNYKLGDMVVLIETVGGAYTGYTCSVGPITYILHGGSFGVPIDYCVFNW